MKDFVCGINGDADYSDHITKTYSSGLSRLTEQMVRGDITVDDWHQQMRDAIDKMFYFQAAAGANGDRSQIDEDAVHYEAAKQFKYLSGFANDVNASIKAGKQPNFAVSRAVLYAKSSQAEYWRQAVGVELPHVPKDGSTVCLSNCTCDISTECERNSAGKVTAVLVYWHLDPTKEEVHCEDCPKRAEEWNPLRIPITRH